ncbi:MAG: VWA domain-containing protein [Betaproteobacteria bacterium]
MNTQLQALPLSERLAGFAALLREHGMKVGPCEQRDMLQAALALGSLKPAPLQAAWRAIACSNARDWRQWPAVFEQYWLAHKIKGTVKVSGQTRLRRDLRSQVSQMHQAMDAAAAPAPAQQAGLASSDHSSNDLSPEAAPLQRAQGGASRGEPQALHERSAQMWMPQELHALAQLARQIHQQLQSQPTRRWQTHAQGRRLDLRQSLRRSVAHGGLPIHPVWQRKRSRPPQLFVLVDVSRSMESHAAFFLRVARAMAQAADARVFVFHVRLAEVTALMHSDSAAVQEKINAVTAGFGAGTRIATNLQEFARRHARGQLGRHARVWLLSDGFDTDAPDELAKVLQSLRGHGARITWFHPTRQPPSSLALAQARTLIDRFIPLANLADLARARPLLH